MSHAEDDTVVYFAGTQLVLYNVQTQSQRFIPVKEGLSVSCFAISVPYGLVAVAVVTDKAPMIVVYDLVTLKKRKGIPAPENATSKV
jgi:hypothetical protein